MEYNSKLPPRKPVKNTYSRSEKKYTVNEMKKKESNELEDEVMDSDSENEPDFYRDFEKKPKRTRNERYISHLIKHITEYRRGNDSSEDPREIKGILKNSVKWHNFVLPSERGPYLPSYLPSRTVPPL